jgi:hypothetical protein
MIRSACSVEYSRISPHEKHRQETPSPCQESNQHFLARRAVDPPRLFAFDVPRLQRPSACRLATITLRLYCGPVAGNLAGGFLLRLCGMQAGDGGVHRRFTG